MYPFYIDNNLETNILMATYIFIVTVFEPIYWWIPFINLLYIMISFY